MNILRRVAVWRFLVVLSVLCLSGAPSWAVTELPFVKTMQDSTKKWRGELLDLRESAENSAEKLVAGGNLYVATTQRSFQMEALGRSGGLTMIKTYTDKIVLTANDTVLVGLDADSNTALLQPLLDSAKEAKASVIVFAGPSRSVLGTNSGVQIFPRRLFLEVPYGAAPGVESVNNLIGLWTWTASLVSACVVEGKMPSLFRSNAMPGGGERNMQFRRTPFHTYSGVNVDSVRYLSARYLDALNGALATMNKTQPPAFEKGAKVLRDAQAGGKKVHIGYMGHIFPYELQGKDRPSWSVAAKTQVDATVPAELTEGDVFLLLGYQYFPWELTSALQEKKIKSIVTTSMPPLDRWVASDSITYINPVWAVQDAVVPLRGYDIEILPISGVMQASVYWQLAQLAK
jgi:hypothetical protein